MNKKKALICAFLLYIVFIAILIWSTTIKNQYGISLYSIMSAIGFGFWLSEKIADFYDWLIKGDESK